MDLKFSAFELLEVKYSAFEFLALELLEFESSDLNFKPGIEKSGKRELKIINVQVIQLACWHLNPVY